MCHLAFMIHCAVHQPDGSKSPFQVSSDITLSDLCHCVAEKLEHFPDHVVLWYQLDINKASAGPTSIRTMRSSNSSRTRWGISQCHSISPVESYLLIHRRLFMCVLKMWVLKTMVYWLWVMAIVRFVFISIYFFQSLMSKLFVIRARILHAQSLQETNLQVPEHMSKERGRQLLLNFKNAGSVRCTQ